jgi:chromosome segregation ATPase
MIMICQERQEYYITNQSDAPSLVLIEGGEARASLVQVTELTGTIENRDSSIESLQKRMIEIETNADALAVNMSLTEAKLEQATSQVASLTSELETKVVTITSLEKYLHDVGEKYDNNLMQTNTLFENATAERDELKADVTKPNLLNLPRKRNLFN